MNVDMKLNWAVLTVDRIYKATNDTHATNDILKDVNYICATNVSCVHSFDLNHTTVLLRGY